MPYFDLLSISVAYTGSSDVKESVCSAGDPGLIAGSGRFSREGNGYPLQLFLPGESHGQRSLEGYSPWSHKELDMAEKLTLSLFLFIVILFCIIYSFFALLIQ